MPMYEVWVHTPDYSSRTAIIAEVGYSWVFSRLIIERKENQVTESVLTLPYQAGIVALFPLDTRLEFYDNGRLEGETQWFVRVPPKLVYDELGVLVVEVHAVCALYLLSGRIVAYAAGSIQAVKSGPADDVIKALVRENLGALAIADRDLSAYLDVQADAGDGATVYKTMPRRNVLLVCQEIARSTAQSGLPIFFDIVWTGSRLEFRTYLEARGADHRAGSAAPIVLSPEFGTLSNASRSFDHRDEITVVYCAGQGRGDERMIVSVSDDARRTATPFNRRESFVDARYLALESSVATEADGSLWRRRPVQQIGGTFEDTDTWRYGRDWSWGDLAAGEFNGEVLDVRVHAVRIVVEGGDRSITGELRADSTEADDVVRRIEGRLDSGAAEELPVFSETPSAGAVPVADEDGVIADGWLSASIARLADVAAEATARAAADTAEATARAAADSAHAALTTSAHGGIVASTDSRLTDARTPLAHAASHKHGGSDEIAAATPAANAIPKAGAASTIADGWLSSVISRITSIALSLPSIFSVSGSPLTANGTLSATLANQSANVGLFGPASGGAAAPTFRALVAADIPNLDTSKLTTGALPVVRGGTGVAAIPAFSAWKLTAQAIAPSTFTKLTINNEFRDTNNNFDPSNSRFTPTVAGIYLFTAYAVYIGPNQDQKGFGVYVYKNGARSLVVENFILTSGTSDLGVPMMGLISANGTTDYFELYTYQTMTVNGTVWEGAGNFSAIWVGP
jgi:hypothetical protein